MAKTKIPWATKINSGYFRKTRWQDHLVWGFYHKPEKDLCGVVVELLPDKFYFVPFSQEGHWVDLGPIALRRIADFIDNRGKKLK